MEWYLETLPQDRSIGIYWKDARKNSFFSLFHTNSSYFISEICLYFKRVRAYWLSAGRKKPGRFMNLLKKKEIAVVKTDGFWEFTLHLFNDASLYSVSSESDLDPLKSHLLTYALLQTVHCSRRSCTGFWELEHLNFTWSFFVLFFKMQQYMTTKVK